MHMMIRYESGLRAEAVLLAASRERIRAAIKSEKDTAEFHWVEAGWYTERGMAVEIEAMVPLMGTDFSNLCTAVYPRTNVAGRDVAFV
jgi:hypothetical protein